MTFIVSTDSHFHSLCSDFSQTKPYLSTVQLQTFIGAHIQQKNWVTWKHFIQTQTRKAAQTQLKTVMCASCADQGSWWTRDVTKTPKLWAPPPSVKWRPTLWTHKMFEVLNLICVFPLWRRPLLWSRKCAHIPGNPCCAIQPLAVR